MPYPAGLVFDAEAERCKFPKEPVTESGTETSVTK